MLKNDLWLLAKILLASWVCCCLLFAVGSIFFVKTTPADASKTKKKKTSKKTPLHRIVGNPAEFWGTGDLEIRADDPHDEQIQIDGITGRKIKKTQI